MRVFWALVVVLLLAGGAAAFFARPSTPASPPSSPPPNGTVVKSDKFTTDIAWTAPTKSTPAVPPAKPEASTPAPSVDFSKELNNAINDAVNGGNAATSPESSAPVAKGAAVELPMTEAFPPAKVIPCKAEKIGNELVIDGKYHIKGAGTKESPYVVPFDLLMSASDVYDPRKGLSKMPQRVAFLSEHWVTLTGYVAFPISSTDPKELLVMFNQWDGCCIGVPPTAYDAVETKLDAPVKGDDKFTTFGTVTGLFKVDPYVDNGWLLGLYMMDHATLSNSKSEPVSPKQMPEN
ncbi:MAG: hypothetical protein QM783_15095 [Phycisphaerales bacterium]